MLFKKKISHLSSSLVLILILLYGILKYRFIALYSDIVYSILIFIGIDSSALLSNLNLVFKSEVWKPNLLGWFIYYPSYYFLHILFIHLLFNKSKKIKNLLVISLTTLIALLVSGTIIGKMTNQILLYEFCYDTFHKLFGLPFILLFIEGGRILYNDIMNKV